jgi:hypothetical protein
VLEAHHAGLAEAVAYLDEHQLVGIPDGRGIRVALLSPRLLSNRVNSTPGWDAADEGESGGRGDEAIILYPFEEKRPK